MNVYQFCELPTLVSHFVNFSLQNPFNNKTHSFVHKAMYIIIREYSPIKLQQHKQNLYIWYNYRGAQYRQLVTSNSTIRVARDGALETCRPLDIQQFNFFSSLQSCNKSDVDFVRFPFQTYLCYVVSFSRNNFRVALCPLTPHPGTATQFNSCYSSPLNAVLTIK